MFQLIFLNTKINSNLIYSNGSKGVNSHVQDTWKYRFCPSVCTKNHLKVQKAIRMSIFQKIIWTSKKMPESRKMFYSDILNFFSVSVKFFQSKKILNVRKIFWRHSYRQTMIYLPVDTESKVSCFWVKKISFW